MAINNLKNTTWIIKSLSVTRRAITYVNYSVITVRGEELTGQTAFYEGFNIDKSYIEGCSYYPSGVIGSVGDIITFTGGATYLDDLIAWFETNAEVYIIPKLTCSINFDDEWIQNDCHWAYDRIFTITWKITDYQQVAQKEFYYRIGTYKDDYTKYIQISSPKERDLRNNSKSWTYDLRLSSIDIDTLVAARTGDDKSWLPITAYLKVANSYGHIFTKYFTYDYYLELPPVMEESAEKIITTDFVIDNPGEIKVSWKSAKELDGSDAENSPDSLDGYSIEVFHCPKDPTNPNKHLDSKNFTRLNGLKWLREVPDVNTTMEEEYAAYKYILTRVPVNIDIETPEVLEGEEKIFSYANLNPGSEVYIEKPLKVKLPKAEFYFNPKHLDIKPSDHYKFVIRPYSHYEGALISNEGTESDVYKVRPGFVHVKTANGWEAGQVWVYTEKGWIVAEAVYTKTADGWKEAI